MRPHRPRRRVHGRAPAPPAATPPAATPGAAAPPAGTPPPPLARVAAGALAAAILAGGLGACDGGRPSISNGAVAGCAKALPSAVDAVHEAKARLLGVHRVPADRLPPRVRQALPPGDDQTVCAVAFRGDFRAGQVTGARPAASGSIAVVLVDATRLRVVASYVGDHLPRGLAGRLL